MACVLSLITRNRIIAYIVNVLLQARLHENAAVFGWLAFTSKVCTWIQTAVWDASAMSGDKRSACGGNTRGLFFTNFVRSRSLGFVRRAVPT